MRKKLIISIIVVLLLALLILFNSDKLELLMYEVIVADDIDYFASSVNSFVAVKEFEKSYTYHVFLKNKNKVLKNEHITIEINKSDIAVMHDFISRQYGEVKVLDEYPHIRFWMPKLTEENVMDALYHTIDIEDGNGTWHQVEFHYSSNHILIFDGINYEEITE